MRNFVYKLLKSFMRSFAYKLLVEGRRGGAMPELPDSSELALASAGPKPHSGKAHFSVN